MRPLAGDAVMSIAQMIAAHPDVAGKLNEPLALAVRHAMFCSAICTSCADACVAEKMDLRDRKSTRLKSRTNAQLVCRLLLEKKKKSRTPLQLRSSITHL